MKAILLAAGTGSRLRPITNTIPKCLVPIDGRPLLEIWLEQLTTHGVEEFLINTHYLAEKVADYISKSEYRRGATLVYEQDLLGTAGTVWANKDWIADEPVMLIHADNLCLCNMSGFIENHMKRPPHVCMSMMTFNTEYPETCGIIQIDAQGVVTEMDEKPEKPRGNLANAAVYILEPEVVRGLAGKTDFSTEVIPQYMNRILSWQNKGFHEDIGTREKYVKASDIYSSIYR